MSHCDQMVLDFIVYTKYVLNMYYYVGKLRKIGSIVYCIPFLWKVPVRCAAVQ